MTKVSRSVVLRWVVAAGLVFSASQATAQAVRRVVFKPGTSGTTIEGSIKGYQDVTYLLSAKAGQKMTVCSNRRTPAPISMSRARADTALFMGAQKGAASAGCFRRRGTTAYRST